MAVLACLSGILTGYCALVIILGSRLRSMPTYHSSEGPIGRWGPSPLHALHSPSVHRPILVGSGYQWGVQYPMLSQKCERCVRRSGVKEKCWAACLLWFLILTVVWWGIRNVFFPLADGEAAAQRSRGWPSLLDVPSHRVALLGWAAIELGTDVAAVRKHDLLEVT